MIGPFELSREESLLYETFGDNSPSQNSSTKVLVRTFDKKFYEPPATSSLSRKQQQRAMQNRWQLGEVGGKIAITPTGKSEVVIDFGAEPETIVQRKAIPSRKKSILKESKMPKFMHKRKNKELQPMQIQQVQPPRDADEIAAERTIAQFLKNTYYRKAERLSKPGSNKTSDNEDNKSVITESNLAAKVYKNATAREK